MSDPAAPEVGEARWPMASAVIAVIVLTFLLPHNVRLVPGAAHLLLALLEIVLLVALIVGDPGRIDRTSKTLQRLAMALVLLLVAGALGFAARLSIQLVDNSNPALKDPRTLFAAGAIVWLVLDIAFALLFWQIDSGGPAARARRLTTYHDFAFPQHLEPVVAPPGWQPEFFDYLYLGFTNAVALSPTDVMPLTHRAKLPMLVQSLASFVLIGLVIARAVNVL